MTFMQKHTRPRYDATAIAQKYRQAPLLVLRRLITIIWILGGFFLRFKLDEWRGVEDKNKYKRARELREILTKLGPTYIKVGQALSTRPDLIRKDFLEELTKLQDELPCFDSAIAFQIIEQELQRPVKEVYREISPQPVAAASLGQVYRGVLHTGEEVAVKVQRPNLEPILTLDLFIMRSGMSKFKSWLPLNLGHDLTLIIDEFGMKLFEEIDYINEGKNAEKFARNFQNDSTIKVPKIYWDYSTYCVLTLEWINGFKLTDTDQIKAANLEQNQLVEVGVIAGLRQLLEHGFFHADPHPGNLFAMADGRMAYIDFGMMDQLEEETKETIASSIVHLLNQDYHRLAEDFVFLGFLAPNTKIEPILPALEQVLGNAMGESVKNFNFKTITDQFSELMYEYPFRVPAKFALIIRSLITQEGLALTLDPDFKIVEVAYPYVAQRLLRGESPEMRQRLLEVLFKDGKFQWQRLENMISIARSNGENFDLLPTARLGLQYLLSEEGNYLRRKLLLALTEDEQLQTEQMQRLWNLVKDDLKPAKLFDVALDSLREISLTEAAAIQQSK
ncbi:ABC1 kinase family protein [Dactylococcopsis salina]|uniref:Unusual protein kinase n=1 Tax=Dactylococcopsis salina (strain PCC 8305) TaxID=13035 RepID=K9YQS0_DACS8|nr:AarF/ABC1/UbiB kinase family protein [Dactylococcopsis salina]AFZ49266.1 putative unusual protein kinase [Dactylococcopsis salina PCC 8305]